MTDPTQEQEKVDSGPSNDISVASKFPTATKVEDGTAYDITGKKLGSVDESESPAPASQDPFAALGATAAPKPEDAQADPFAALGATAAPNPEAARLQGRPVPVPYSELGNLFYAKPMPGEENKGVIHSLHGFLSFPNAMYHAFADPATDAEKKTILQKINQENARAGTEDPKDPNHVPETLATSPSRTTMAWHRLVDAPADELNAKGDRELEASRELWDKRHEWSTPIPVGMGVSIPLGHAISISQATSGAADKVLSAIPVMGPMINGISEKFEKGDVSGGMADLALLKIAEAAHEEVGGVIKGEAPPVPSKVFGETGERYGQTLRDWFEKTNKPEVERPDISEKATKAKKDFMNAVPPSKAAAYDDNDYEIVRRGAEAVHEADKLQGGEGINGIEAARDAVEDSRQAIENKRSNAVKEHGSRPITTNVFQDVADALEEADKVTPGFREEGMQVLEKHNLKDPTVAEADAIRKKLVADNRGIQKKNMWDVMTARQTDPTFAAREAAINSLREGIYGALGNAGVPEAYDWARDEAAHIRVRDAIERQIFNGEKTVPKTGEAGFVRKGLAKAAPVIGTAGGAAVGSVAGPVGAAVGAGIGGVGGAILGEKIAPSALTRDALIARSFEPSVATPEGPSVPPSQATGGEEGPEIPPPPQPVSPTMPPPDHSMHAALATRVGTTVARSNFDQLMTGFQRYLEKTAPEKLTDTDRQLLQQLNESQANHRLAVQEAVQKAAEETKAAREKWQADVKKIQDKAAADAEKAQQKRITDKIDGKVETPVIEELDDRGMADDSGLVAHSAAMKATAPIMPIPGLPEGMTSEMALRHEFAHAALGAVDGLNPIEIRSDLHKASTPGSGASTVFDITPVVDADGNVDPDALRTQLTQWLTKKMAGPASHEIFDGLTKEEALAHKATRSDIREARNTVREAYPEFTPKQIADTVDAAYDRAREFLTKPHIADRIRANAVVREEGLSQTLHASNGRLAQFADDIRKAHDEYTGNEPRPDGGQSGEGGEKAEKPAAKDGKEKNAGGDKERGGGESRKPVGESDSARGLSQDEVTAENPNRDVVEGAGLKYKGELVKGSDVHMFEHPDHPGKTAALQGPLTPDAVKAKMASKLKEFGVEAAPEKQPFAGTHYSTVPAENGVLSGASRGKANAGSEAARVALGAEPGVYAYREGTRPEAQIASRANKYSIRGDKAIADISGAQKGLFEDAYQKAKDAALKSGDNDTVAGHKGLNAAETALKNAGYDGYEHKADYPGNTFLFGDQKVDQPLGEHELRDAANQFNKERGRPEIDTNHVPEDPRSSAVADAYKASTHAPNDPAVKASYDALKRDVDEQYELAKKLGIKMDVKDVNPYGLSEAVPAHEELHNDVRNNKHLSVWSGGAPPADHPLSEIDPKTGLTYNDKFRMVHDIFGHAAERTDFSPSGEETAWNLHRQMFSPEARPALATETKGQAAYTYKYGDFPPQKAAILPEEYHAPAKLTPEEVGTSQIAKGSTVPLMKNPLEVEGTGEKGKVSTLDVAQALNEYSQKKNPALEPGSDSKAMTDRAKKIAEDEAKYQLASGKTGTEWYTTEMKDHDKVLQQMRPELNEGPDVDAVPGHTAKLSLFKAAEAVLSSGQKPYSNFKSAVKAWDAYNETGEFPRLNPATGKSWGPRGVAAYGNGLDMINQLIQEKGEKGAADWLLSEHPVSELKKYNKNTKGPKDSLLPGAIVLGAKRGPFMQNLHGIESAFTADMWVSRSWNRWMGTMEFGKNPEGDMEIKSDSPRSGTERNLMKQSFEDTAKKLNLSTSSLQAVLWYYEQALYSAHGVPKESWSFRDAAQRAANEEGATPEEEQTGFNFGQNDKKAEGGFSYLGNLPTTPDNFVNFRSKIGESNIMQEPTYTVPKGWSKTGPTKAPGLLQPGNIDLTTRPVVKNDDGSHSSEYSISFEDEKGRNVLIPTVVNGKFLTSDGKKPVPGSPAEKAMFEKAKQHYRETGEHMGIFDTWQNADKAAEAIHSRPQK